MFDLKTNEAYHRGSWKTKKFIFDQHVKGLMAGEAPIIACLSQKQRNKFARIFNAGLKNYAGLSKETKHEDALALTGELSMQNWAKLQLAMNCIKTHHYTENTTELDKLQSRITSYSKKSTRTPEKIGAMLLHRFGLTSCLDKIVSPNLTTSYNIPPWQRRTYHVALRAPFDKHTQKIKARVYATETFLSALQNNDYVVVCDGSADQLNLKIGGAYAIYSKANNNSSYKLIRAVKVNMHCCGNPFMAELYALNSAITRMNTLYPNKKICFLSDCMSVLSTINSNTVNCKYLAQKKLIYTLNSHPTTQNFNFAWIPSHIGFSIHDSVDKLAKSVMKNSSASNINITTHPEIEYQILKLRLKMKLLQDQKEKFLKQTTHNEENHLSKYIHENNFHINRKKLFSDITQFTPTLNRLRTGITYMSEKEYSLKNVIADPCKKMYSRLGLTPRTKSSYPAEVIHRQFRKLALKLHPDRCQHKNRAKQKFQRLVEAKEILTDPDTKLMYIRTTKKTTHTIKKWTGNHKLPNCICAHKPSLTIPHLLLHCPILNGARKAYAIKTNQPIQQLTIQSMLVLNDLTKVKPHQINTRVTALQNYIQAAKKALPIKFL